MFRRKRSRKMPWLALLGLAAADQFYRRRSRSRFIPYDRYSRGRFRRRQNGVRGIVQMLLLERVGYFSPWFVALRMAANSFRRRGGATA